MTYPSDLTVDALLFNQRCTVEAFAMFPKDRGVLRLLLAWNEAEIKARLAGGNLTIAEDREWERKYLEAQRERAA
jgi:hypothetical protein